MPTSYEPSYGLLFLIRISGFLTRDKDGRISENP